MNTKPLLTRSFLTLCVVGFLGRLSYEMARSPLSPLLAQKLGAPPVIIGLIVASVTISGIFVKLPSGALSDVFGYRTLMLVGGIVKMVGPFLYLPVTAFLELIPIRLFHGLATATYAPAAAAWVAAMDPKNRARRLGIYSAAENVGVLLGPTLGGLVLYETLNNFNLAFVISGVIGTAAFLGILSLPADRVERPAAKAENREVLRRLRAGVMEIVHTRPIILTSMMESFMFLGVGTIQAFLPLYVISVHQTTLGIAIIFAAQGAASLLSRPSMGELSDRIGRKPVILIGLISCTVGLAVIPHVDSLLGLAILSALFGFGWGSVTPSTSAMIADLCKEQQLGSAMGVFGSIWDVGHATGPILAGVLVGVIGYGWAFGLVALLILVGAALFAVAVREPTPVVAG
ncbi:MAG TPA: MFS transporter [Chloroflexota bacterium]|nr:MFS transporter [Chloroflexota bacterium]